MRSRLVPFRSRLGPASARALACGRGSLRRPSGSLAMPRSEDRWRPARRPLATARSRRVTFHPYKGTERRKTVAARSEEKTESRGRPAQRPVFAFPIAGRLTPYPHSLLCGGGVGVVRTLLPGDQWESAAAYPRPCSTCRLAIMAHLTPSPPDRARRAAPGTPRARSGSAGNLACRGRGGGDERERR